LARALSLAAVLFVLWYLLSGHDEPLLLSLGGASAVAVTLIAWRKGSLDREGHPIHLIRRAPAYWAWLAWQIVKANIDVARRCLDPRLPISPTLVTLKASQGSDLGRVIYANSITLTPGTVSVAVEGDRITVHALSRESAQDLARGEMDRRASAMSRS